MSKSKFRLDGRFDGASGVTVTIDRNANIFSVRPLHRKRAYELPLMTVAEMVFFRIVKGEVLQKRLAKAAKRKKP